MLPFLRELIYKISLVADVSASQPHLSPSHLNSHSRTHQIALLQPEVQKSKFFCLLDFIFFAILSMR